jgi:hypothetical protein
MRARRSTLLVATVVVASGLGLAACGGGTPAAAQKHVATSTTAPLTPGAPTTTTTVPLGPDAVTQLNGQLNTLDTMLNQATTDLNQAPSDS